MFLHSAQRHSLSVQDQPFNATLFLGSELTCLAGKIQDSHGAEVVYRIYCHVLDAICNFIKDGACKVFVPSTISKSAASRGQQSTHSDLEDQALAMLVCHCQFCCMNLQNWRRVRVSCKCSGRLAELPDSKSRAALETNTDRSVLKPNM